MAIKIKVTETIRKLQDLVRQDVLYFPNSRRLDETVMVVDKGKGDLYTQRIRGDMEERVLYHLQKVGEDFVFNSKSEGFVYQTKKVEGKK